MTTILTPQDRANALGNNTVYRLDLEMMGGMLRVCAKVKSFTPDEHGMVHLIGAHHITEREKDGEVIGITMAPLVAYAESVTSRVRADVIYSYAVAAPNISQAFFSEIGFEIAGDLNDVSDELREAHA
jgi:hypothetical protein